MKRSFGIQAVALFMILTLGPQIARADGPSGSGGGNEIRSKFRAKVAEITDLLESLSPAAKRELKFDPSQIKMNLNLPGRFNPQCAQGNLLAKMIADNQMAHVEPKAASIIWLDCRPEMQEVWNRLFSSGDPEDYALFVHEALRNIHPDEDDDKTGASASYLTAIDADRPGMEKALATLVQNGRSETDSEGFPRGCYLFASDTIASDAITSVGPIHILMYLNHGEIFYHDFSNYQDRSALFGDLVSGENGTLAVSIKIYAIYRNVCNQGNTALK